MPSPALRIVAEPAPAAPRARPVERPRLVRRLAGARGGVVVLAAPAGYGKTTLLHEWEAADDRPFRWIAPRAVRQAAPPAAGAVLVVDDAHAVRSRAGLAALADGDGTLVLSARAAPALPLARLRAAGALLELGAAELAMTHGEAALGLRRAGLDLQAREVGALMRRTEGWPAGLALAALTLAEQHHVASAVAHFAGDDRLVAEYLRDEQLAALTADSREFLTRTSPLSELSGELCDAVLDREGSGRLLCELARSNLLLAPVDRADEHFRFHPMLADMLRAELRRAEPRAELDVHRRASAWYEQHDDDRAVEHALAAGDLSHAAELMWRRAGEHAGLARPAPLGRWIASLRTGQVAAKPALALTAALECVLRGRRDEAEHWTGMAERRELPGELGAGAALLRAMVARDDVATMACDAERGAALADADSPWRALACLLAGVGHHLAGDRERGLAELEEGVRVGAVIAPAYQALCLAQLALAALEDDEPERATELAGRARDLVLDASDRGRSLTLVFATWAYAAARRGDIEAARAAVTEARRRLTLNGEFAPWYEAETRIALARAELRLSDSAAARTLLAEASRAVHRVPQAVVLREWMDVAWERADTFAVQAVSGPSTLTTAELRVLRFLPSHLSFREIAERLHVSANTVKTQAHAVYRKLDASSRSEAVARARDVGLVES